MDTTKISKFLSLVLRHRPAAAFVTLDEAGWVEVDALIEGAQKAGVALDFNLLEQVVDENDKQRFEFNEDVTRIRARQGHSVQVALGYPASEPPEFLYHGTAPQFLNAIRKNGLQKMKRHAVHLSPDKDTAIRVGARRGLPVILRVNAGKMHQAGHRFEVTGNRVWLTEHVPSEYIEFP